MVPDGAACRRETQRLLRSGGRIVIFDKFAPQGASPSLGRRLLNGVTTLLGTNITRRLDDLLDRARPTVLQDEPHILGGPQAYCVALASTIT